MTSAAVGVGEQERDPPDVVKESRQERAPDLDPAGHARELLGGDADGERVVPELLGARASRPRRAAWRRRRP